MKRGLLILLTCLLLSLSFASAGIEESFSEVEDYMNQYDAGELTAPQLMVYVAYARNKMYEGEDKGDLTESEVEKHFDKIDKEKNKNYWQGEYEKTFSGEDFNVIFRAQSFVKNDREYYESREEVEKSYYVDYEFVPVISGSSSLEKDLEGFLDKLEGTFDSEEKLNYEELQEEFSAIRTSFERKSYDNSDYCLEFVDSIGYEKRDDGKEEYYESSKEYFSNIIEVEMTEECWTNPKCEQECETKEECDGGYEDCWMETVCEDAEDEERCEEVCEVKEVCEEIEGEEVCNEIEECEEKCEKVDGEDECYEKEVCENREGNCWEYEDCHEECEDEEECNEWESGQFGLDIECRGDEGASMWLNTWGEQFDRYQPINEGMGWNCEPEMQSLVAMRKSIQEDFNLEFVNWYFEEFIGEDYLKIMNGGDVLRDIVWNLINIDERVSENLHCSETGEWPEGFERIDIIYDNGNTHFEVWEKFIPIEGMDVEYYTTMYKYNWAPDKEMAKDLITYMVDNEFGPNARDIAKMKSDEGQMALIESIAGKYGGSLDIELKLSQENNDFEILRYVSVNPEEAIAIKEEEIKTDISIEIDYDILYNFIISITQMEERDRIEGPYWVQIHEDEGADNFFSAIGLISKAWREGVTIKPKYALIKMFFSARDVAEFMTSGDSLEEEYTDTSKISGEVVLARE